MSWTRARLPTQWWDSLLATLTSLSYISLPVWGREGNRRWCSLGKTHILPDVLQGPCRWSWCSPQQRLCLKGHPAGRMYTLRKLLFQTTVFWDGLWCLTFEHLHEKTREGKENKGKHFNVKAFWQHRWHEALLSFKLRIKKIIGCSSFPARRTRTLQCTGSSPPPAGLAEEGTTTTQQQNTLLKRLLI